MTIDNFIGGEVRPDAAGEFVVIDTQPEAAWAYIPDGYEAVVVRKEPGSLGVCEVAAEHGDHPVHLSTIGIKFVKIEDARSTIDGGASDAEISWWVLET